MKFWAKLVTDSKIRKDKIFFFDQTLSEDFLDEALREIAEFFDLSTPLSLHSHYTHFRAFNSVRYKKSDFIDEIGYDYLEIENCAE